MNKKLIFVPMLKTKNNAELNALKNFNYLFDVHQKESNNFIPYLELIRKNESTTLIKYLKLLKNKKFFLQYLKEDLEDLSTYLKKSLSLVEKSDNSIIAIEIDRFELIENYKKIIDFINTLRSFKRDIAIRIKKLTSLEPIKLIEDYLKESDYLIIDVEDNEFPSILNSLSILKKEVDIDINIKGKTLIFSEERIKPYSPSLYENKSFTLRANYSVIDSIKNNNFKYDGFGSFCYMKNEINENEGGMNLTYALYNIYSFDKNMVYVFKSKNKDVINKIYTSSKNDFLNYLNTNNKLSFLKKDSFVYKKINEYFLKEKLSLNKVNELTILIYVEEIIRNLF